MSPLCSVLFLVAFVSAAPLDINPAVYTGAPVQRQFTFTPIPVNEAPSTEATPIESIPNEQQAIQPVDQPMNDNVPLTLIEQPAPIVESINPTIESSGSIPENVILVGQQDSQPVLLKDELIEGSGESQVVQENTAESTTTVIPTATNATELPVLRDEPVQVQVVQTLNSETAEVSSTSVETTVAPLDSSTTSVDVALLNDSPVEGSGAEDQPQLDFVDASSYGLNGASPDSDSNTAYQYLNLTDTSAKNLVVNISLPSLTSSDLMSRLQYSSSQLNYTEKLDLALQLTALAHNLMTSVDDQLSLSRSL